MAKKRVAGSAQERVNLSRQEIDNQLKALNELFKNTTDSKQRKRINTQKKALIRQKNDLNQRPGGQRTGIDAKGGTKGRVAVDTGKQAHHRTSLNNAAQFYDGLDLPEKNIMDQAMAALGIVPSDVTLNRLDMFGELHQGGIHALERELDLEGKVYFPEGATFEQKLAAVEEFAADQKLLSSLADRSQFTAENELQGLSKRVESTATDELSEEFHNKGQRRRREQSRDFRDYQPETHAVANALGQQNSLDNTPRLQALDPYMKDGTVDLARLKSANKSGKFELPAIAQLRNKLNGNTAIQRRLARQVGDAAGEIPLAGFIAAPVAGWLLGQSPAEAAGDALPIVGDIESDNTADVSREGQLFVDRKTNMVMPTPETVNQGKQGLAYRDGKPVAVPYGSVAGEANTGDMARAFGNQVVQVNQQRLQNLAEQGQATIDKIRSNPGNEAKYALGKLRDLIIGIGY